MPVARLTAQAKVNLFLGVGPRRGDGFHDITTMFQLVDLADDVVVRVGGAGRTLHVAGPRLPDAGLGPTEKNLAFRAARAYAELAGWPEGFSIELTKNIPTGGGLAGGSSDAGAVLRALQALNERPLASTALDSLAATLGSDVPFFVSGSASALATSRGEEVGGLDPLSARHVLLAIPPFGVATADAYRWLDEDRASAGRPAEPARAGGPAVGSPLAAAGSDAIDWPILERVSFNDFEPVVEQRHPGLAGLRDLMTRSGASIARLSGSGSTVFGIFERLPSLPAEAGSGVTVLRTRTSVRVVQVEVLE